MRRRVYGLEAKGNNTRRWLQISNGLSLELERSKAAKFQLERDYPGGKFRLVVYERVRP